MNEILQHLINLKHSKHYTFDQLSQKLGFPSTTIARWIGRDKINKVYAELLKERLKLL